MNLLHNPQWLAANLAMSLLVFATAARIYLLPHLGRWPAATLLTPILLMHALRHLGLLFLSPGATLTGMPDAFAYPAAFGDLATAALAGVALWAVRSGAPSARTWLWTFNILGTLDLLLAVGLGVALGAAAHMGAAVWIPAFWVPMLLVLHGVIFVFLLRPA